MVEDMNRELTEKEQLENNRTRQHIIEVVRLMNDVVINLLERSSRHDDSKLKLPEVAMFAKYGPRLKNLTYNSKEYKECLSEMKKEALGSHYSYNEHHPEHYKNGISDMNLIDLIEMFVDWNASAKRHDDGCITKSLKINKDRFQFSDELHKIFNNTVKYLGW